ncbi:HAMP domain-containing histidine kinase [Flammeovirga sp. MY04]|uniref:hypothetical protein n=1 Tax=Flammeovirga sp. MY04 TaxID=1191459 RepID=UPI001305365B|nr:hypothetical protein [Flammeovirga sp. MY04]ANQ48898.2 HAMP domain-containing histidine kinase [Flammeovirga sp. MY04]
MKNFLHKTLFIASFFLVTFNANAQNELGLQAYEQERLIWIAAVIFLFTLCVSIDVLRRRQQKRGRKSYNAQKEKINFLEEKIKELEEMQTKPSRINKPKIQEEIVEMSGENLPQQTFTSEESHDEEYTSSRLKGVHGDSLRVVENDDVGELTMVSTHNFGKLKEIQPKEFMEELIEEVKDKLPDNVSIDAQIGGAPKVKINPNSFTKAINALIRCSAHTIEGNGKITISLYASLGEAQISISDNGRGWGFDGQSSEDIKTLDLAKKILKAQNASFDMNAQQGKGTEMVISISNK